ERLLARPGLDDLAALVRERQPQRLPDALVVLDQQQPRLRAVCTPVERADGCAAGRSLHHPPIRIVGVSRRRGPYPDRALPPAGWATIRGWTSGCDAVRLSSPRDRATAHAIYRSLGYRDRCPDHAQFIRPLR